MLRHGTKTVPIKSRRAERPAPQTGMVSVSGATLIAGDSTPISPLHASALAFCPSGSGNVTRWGIDHRETNPRSVLTRWGGNRRGLRHFDLGIAVSEGARVSRATRARLDGLQLTRRPGSFRPSVHTRRRDHVGSTRIIHVGLSMNRSRRAPDEKPISSNLPHFPTSLPTLRCWGETPPLNS